MVKLGGKLRQQAALLDWNTAVVRKRHGQDLAELNQVMHVRRTKKL